MRLCAAVECCSFHVPGGLIMTPRITNVYVFANRRLKGAMNKPIKQKEQGKTLARAYAVFDTAKCQCSKNGTSA